VLSATIQTLIVPAIATEGATVDVSAEAKGGPGLMFDWTVTRDTQVIDTGTTQDFSFVPPDDGIYRVDLKVSDPSDETMDTGSALLIVDNVAPKIENLAARNILENESTTLTGKIVDPGADTFTLDIDWGDPASPGNLQSIDLNTPTAGVEFDAETGEFAITHQYLDDNPTGVTDATYNISVIVTDDDRGKSTAETTVEVANVRPTLSRLSVIDINENGTTTLTGQISDPGTLDTFTLAIDWGDPLSPGNVETIDLTNPGEGVTFDPETGKFSVTHQYLDDNPTNESGAIYDVDVTAADDDLGATTETIKVGVANVAPRLEEVAVFDIDENGTTTLTGRIVDPGTLDTYTLTVNWGDGRIEEFTFAAGASEFSLDHQYLDDPAGLPDKFDIRLTLVDDDQDMAVDAVNVGVANVPPVLNGIDDVTIDEGRQVVISTLLPPGGGTGDAIVVATFSDVGTLDTHSATINWGDGSATAPLMVAQGAGGGALEGAHTYADNGVYTVVLTLVDDDGGRDAQSFTVTVNNVAPELTLGVADLSVDEGELLVIDNLGTFSDPGFDNPLNSPEFENGGETRETFTYNVDWGDGTFRELRLPVTTLTGAPGTPTTGVLTDAHHPLKHTYADNGEYTVTVMLRDDDGGVGVEKFLVTVNNVAPTLHLSSEVVKLGDAGNELLEGDTVTIHLLGTFTDPGFNNPLNRPDLGNGGERQETFTYSIDWGDGTVQEYRIPASTLSGRPGVETTGTLIDAPIHHHYLDNDIDGVYDSKYHVKVTLKDDDGGETSEVFEVTVWNINPSLDPITATDLASNAVTTLTLSFADPGAIMPAPGDTFPAPGTEVFTVQVDWENDGTFVEERMHAGPTPETFVINHRFRAPPNPNNPAEDITIKVMVQDDDFGTAATSVQGEIPSMTFVPGQSNVRSVTIDNPGIEDNNVAIDTTPEIVAIEFPSAMQFATSPSTQSSEDGVQQAPDLRSVAADISPTADRYFELRPVLPDGTILPGVKLKPDVMENLPELFAKLPDYHYQIWLVRTENKSERLVLDVVVRNGQPIDPSDDTEGARDRPPTSEEDAPPAAAPADAAAPTDAAAQSDDALQATPAGEQPSSAAPLAIDPEMAPEHPTAAWTPDASLLSAGGLAMAGWMVHRRRQPWADQVQETLDQASEQQWRRLRWRHLPR